MDEWASADRVSVHKPEQCSLKVSYVFDRQEGSGVAHATRVHSETVPNALSRRFAKAHSHGTDARDLKRTW